MVYDEERTWTDENINMVAMKHFPNINQDVALKRPILYSNWLSKDYVPVEQEELREFTKARLKVTTSTIFPKIFENEIETDFIDQAK